MPDHPSDEKFINNLDIVLPYLGSSVSLDVENAQEKSRSAFSHPPVVSWCTKKIATSSYRGGGCSSPLFPSGHYSAVRSRLGLRNDDNDKRKVLP
ncbi:hypothetical protein TNCV_4227081 [Trichonephila clavipes]|nr:hypothetical protein TNCV_4227081 [Trichonephila clavipes]